MADLRLAACPWPLQVQRLMASYIADERRHRRNRFALPAEAAVLEPLDTIAWTSARNGYVTKLFEVSGLTDNLMTLTQAVQLRERDAADYDWDAGDEIAVDLPATATSAIAAQTVPGFTVSAVALADSAAADRRPAIEVTWDADAADDATGLEWEIRLAGAASAQLSGTYGLVRSGRLTISASILAGETYEVRARLIVDRAASWTGWQSVTTADVRLTAPDIAVGAVTRGGVAGSAPSITNNSASWTTICSFTISALPDTSFVQGSLACRWTHRPSTFPSSFVMRVTVAGTIVLQFARSALDTDWTCTGFVPVF